MLNYSVAELRFIKKKAWNEFYDRNINHLNEK